MRNYSSSIITDEIVNLTESTISMYEESTGTIYKFSPISTEEAVFKDLDPAEKQYVVSCDYQAEKVVACGASIDNVAILDKQATGRDGKIISYLVWAKNPRIDVKFYHKPS